MKIPFDHRAWLASVIALLLFGFCGPGQATVIDFTGIPDGTPVSAGNPYAGVLNLQGQQTASVFLPPDTTIPVTSEAVITSDIPYRPGNSAIQALPTFLEGAFQYSSAVTATFLQPVFNVSFDAYAFRTAGYSYVAANGAGDFLNGTGTILGDLESGGLVTWQQIGINIPSGYYVTQFSVSNRDPSPYSAAVWLDNIAFDVVPEPATSVLFAVGVVGTLLCRRAVNEWRLRRRSGPF